MIGPFERAVNKSLSMTDKILYVASATGILLLMAITIVDVIGRKLTGASIPGSIEVTEVTLVAVVFLGMLTAGLNGQHIRVSLVTERFPPAVARWIRLVGSFVCVGLVSWVVVATTLRAIHSVQVDESRFGLIGVPIWPARIVIPIGLLALLVLFIRETLDLIRNRRDEPLPGSDIRAAAAPL